MRIKYFCFLIAFFLCASLLLPASGAEKPRAVDQIDDSGMISGLREAPGIGTFRYYAQNDPTWGKMRFRFPHQVDVEPRFSGAGCIPTATANLIANMVDGDQFPSLAGLTWKGKGFYICPCSMNRYDCQESHSRFLIETQADFEKYLCLVIGSFYSGNNTNQEYACGTMYLVGRVLKHFGLKYEYDVSIYRAVRAVQDEGAMAIFMVGGENNVFTTGGHALVLCAATNDTLYLLDSFARTQDEYMHNYSQMLKVIQPGLVTFERAKMERLGAYQIHLVYPKQ